ncbi:hypothetical protein HMPREF9080_00273 [Cardiobacterium valvarum F0432]|uniref:Uncharacterized protein n=1 Tax=Cardiobacterium valvarum F0432 TaxID=797473 RepID=G9ZBZ6_9GAMM|nr:hypothetical protein HMPREF9080_00273 [Cardiobacterium valvarum F0432]
MWCIRLSPTLHNVTAPKVLSARAVQNSEWVRLRKREPSAACCGFT